MFGKKKSKKLYFGGLALAKTKEGNLVVRLKGTSKVVCTCKKSSIKTLKKWL